MLIFYRRLCWSFLPAFPEYDYPVPQLKVYSIFEQFLFSRYLFHTIILEQFWMVSSLQQASFNSKLYQFPLY